MKSIAYVILFLVSTSAFSQINEIDNVGGFSFGAKFDSSQLPEGVQILAADEDGRQWFAPFPKGEFLGIPISPKNVFYFRATPVSGRIYEIGIKVDYLIISKTNIREGLEKYRAGGSYGTPSKRFKLSRAGDVPELYAVIDRELEKVAETERREAKAEAKAKDETPSSFVEPKIPSSPQEGEEKAPAKKNASDFSGDYGFKFASVFNRDKASGRIRILKEENSNTANIVWFVPVDPVNKPATEFFGVPVKLSPWIDKAELKKISETQDFLAAAAVKHYALVTFSSRKIFELGVVMNCPRKGMARKAFEYYAGQFRQFETSARAKEKDGFATVSLCDGKSVRLNLDEKASTLVISANDSSTEEVDVKERNEAEPAKKPLPQDLCDSSPQDNALDQYERNYIYPSRRWHAGVHRH